MREQEAASPRRSIRPRADFTSAKDLEIFFRYFGELTASTMYIDAFEINFA